MTTPDFKAYLESPNHCPWCQSKSIQGGARNFDSNYASLDVSCEDCGQVWQDIYTLTGVFDPETGETHTKED